MAKDQPRSPKDTRGRAPIRPAIAAYIGAWVLVSLYFGVGGWAFLDATQQIKALRASPLTSAPDAGSDDPESDDPESDDAGSDEAGSNSQFRSWKDQELAQEIQAVSKYFPWIPELPTVVVFSITAGAFGAIGASTAILKRITLDAESIDDAEALALPLLGFLGSLLILGVVTLLPDALAFAETAEVRPTAVVFLCLFGGFFTRRLFRWLDSLSAKLFTPK